MTVQVLIGKFAALGMTVVAMLAHPIVLWSQQLYIGYQAMTTYRSPTMILMKKITVQGIYVGSREMFEDMNQAIGTDLGTTFSASAIVGDQQRAFAIPNREGTISIPRLFSGTQDVSGSQWLDTSQDQLQ